MPSIASPSPARLGRLGLLLALVLAGCGGGGGSRGNDDGQPGTVNPDSNGEGDRGTRSPPALTAEPVFSDGVSLAGDTLEVSDDGDTFGVDLAEPDRQEAGLAGYVLEDGTRLLVISEPGADVAGAFALDHGRFGYWVKSAARGVLNGPEIEVLAAAGLYAGTATPEAQVRGRTGTAVFQGGAIAGEHSDIVGHRLLTGSIALTADFDAGTISGSTVLVTPDRESWGVVVMPTMTMQGRRYAGRTLTSTHGHDGTAEGMFTGPEAAETLGTFTLQGPSAVAGAFGARR